jgi:DNA-binding response OmpR family regulator
MGHQSNALRNEHLMSARLLVLNDDEFILNLYKLLFEEQGYTLHLARIAFEDVRDIEDLHPDLIILDIKLGIHYEGFSMLQQMRMYPPTKDIPVIICTAALNMVTEQESTLRAKGIPVIYKPFSLEEILTAVRSALSSRSGNRKDENVP